MTVKRSRDTGWSLRTKKELILFLLLINESIQRLKSNCSVLGRYAMEVEGHRALILNRNRGKYRNFEN